MLPNLFPRITGTATERSVRFAWDAGYDRDHPDRHILLTRVHYTGERQRWIVQDAESTFVAVRDKDADPGAHRTWFNDRGEAVALFEELARTYQHDPAWRQVG